MSFIVIYQKIFQNVSLFSMLHGISSKFKLHPILVRSISRDECNFQYNFFLGISASLSSSLGIPHPPPPSLAGLGMGHHGIPPHILAAQRVGMLPGKSGSTDYTRYFKRFGSSMECGSYYCKDMNYREHFHCTVLMCKDKVRK